MNLRSSYAGFWRSREMDASPMMFPLLSLSGILVARYQPMDWFLVFTSSS